MDSTTHGMNVEEVQRLGADLQAKADEIRQVVSRINGLVQGVTWVGPVASRFKDEWWPGHQARLSSVAGDLHGFGQSALNNAAEQLEASGGGHASGSTAHAVRSETYSVTSSASALIFSADSGATVVMTEMSDGTYRIVISGSFDGDAGVKLSKLFKTVGMDVPVDVGADVGGTLEWSAEFAATDKASAEALRDALQGRASSVTNRGIIGGVDLGEALGQGDGLEGISVEGVTFGEGFDGGAGGEFISGVDANAGAMRYRTVLPDGGSESTYQYETNLQGTGWNADGQSSITSITTSYDAQGNATSITVVEETVHVADTRGGGEKFRDTALGVIPGVSVGNEESALNTVVETRVFDATSLESHQLELAERGEVASFRSTVDDSTGSVVTERYAGSADSSERGFLFGSSETRYGNLELVSRETSGS